MLPIDNRTVATVHSGGLWLIAAVPEGTRPGATLPIDYEETDSKAFLFLPLVPRRLPFEAQETK